MKKILVVDDEQDVLDILQKKFRQNGFEVKTVNNGTQVLSECASFLPDLVILDIVMPESDGYSIAQSLRLEKGCEPVPIIFMTGKELDTRGIQDRIRNFAPCDSITKPCTFEELLLKVKQMLA